MTSALHLFAGGGGSVFTGHLLGWDSVGAVEIVPQFQRMLEHNGEEIVGSDVAQFGGEAFAGDVDVVIGGSPCQDLSVAGKRQGLAGARSGLWYEQLRIFLETGAPLLWWENVAGALSSNQGRDFAALLHSLHEADCDAVWVSNRAVDVGAPHKRERVWLLAWRRDSYAAMKPHLRAVPVTVDPDGWPAAAGMWPRGRVPEQYAWEPSRVCAPKLPDRKWRLMALGNGWVPHQAYSAWRDLAALAQHAYALPKAPLGKKRTSGMMLNGQVYAVPDMRAGSQMVLDRLWATPQARDHFPPHTAEYVASKRAQGHGMANLNDQVVLDPLWPTPVKTDGVGGPGRSEKRKGGDSLRTAVKDPLWPTPTADSATNRTTRYAQGGTSLALAVKDPLWPTPRATEWKGVGPYGSKSHDYRVEKGYLDATVQDVAKRTGVLNPAWVEVLMGWPMGSTQVTP